MTTSFTYDNRNRLTRVTVGGTVVANYTYDALNHRIGFDDNGAQTWVVFDGTSPVANPYADFNGSGALLTRYMSTQAVDQLVARTSSGGTTAWYLTDRLGSVRDIANTSGTVIDHVVYDSYGTIVTETNAANGDRFKFTGMEWDAAINQYYDHARWYGAGTGGFDQQDPMGFGGGGPNVYLYVANAPICAVDRSGLFPSDFTKSTDWQLDVWLARQKEAEQQVAQAEQRVKDEMAGLAKITAQIAQDKATWAQETQQRARITEAQRLRQLAKDNLANIQNVTKMIAYQKRQNGDRMVKEEYEKRYIAKEIQRWIDYYDMIQAHAQALFRAFFGSQAELAQANAAAMKANQDKMNANFAARNKMMNGLYQAMGKQQQQAAADQTKSNSSLPGGPNYKGP